MLTFLFLSILIFTLSGFFDVTLCEISTQEPTRGNISTLLKRSSDCLFLTPRPKYAPGERINWLTITFSLPLIIKLPPEVINGISPRKTTSSLTKPSFVVVALNLPYSLPA
ncbi:hypothetical protein DCBHLPFO_00754 [Mycoplasmopsis arginini]|uniref:Uncharacterized protein n=1 Tax=Mycoplasmopsis arginini TaxID=2094 RepID=A0AA43U2V8_MYCAR|nr:hypothetical protein [Mycoplasmopsis arginini]